jgi:hypothetical protein
MDIISRITLGQDTFIKKNRDVQIEDLTIEEDKDRRESFCVYTKRARLDIGEQFTSIDMRQTQVSYQGCKTREQKDNKLLKVSQEFFEKVAKSQDLIDAKLVRIINEKVDLMIEHNNINILTKYENTIRGMSLTELSKFCTVKSSELEAERELDEVYEKIKQLNKKRDELSNVVLQGMKRGFEQYINEKFGVSQAELTGYFKPNTGRRLY